MIIMLASLCLPLVGSGTEEDTLTVGSGSDSEGARIEWPTITYAAIDVSGSAPGEHSVYGVTALDDGGVMFRYIDEQGTHICISRDGSVVSDTPYKFPYEGGIQEFGEPEEGGYPNYYVIGYSPLLTPSGQWHGTKSRETHFWRGVKDEPNYIYDFLDNWINLAGTLPPPQPPFPDEEHYAVYDGQNEHSYNLEYLSDNGNEIISAETFVSDGGDDFKGEDVRFLHCAGSYTFFDGGHDTPGQGGQFHYVYSTPFMVNNNGWALGRGDKADPGDSTRPGHLACAGYIWAGGSYVGLDTHDNLDVDQPVDINNDNQVIVTSPDLPKQAQSGGYLWDNYQKTYLRDKLPKYLQGQVKDIQPYMISNRASDGTLYILASASDGGTYITVQCKRDDKGKWSFAKIQSPEGVAISGISPDGRLAGSGNLKTANNGQFSRLGNTDQQPPPPSHGYSVPPIELYVFGHKDNVTYDGDLVPSNQSGDETRQHFVTPKTPGQGYVSVKVRVNSTTEVGADFKANSQLVVFKVTGVDSTTGKYMGDPFSCPTDSEGTRIFVPTDTAEHYVVRICQKDDPSNTPIASVERNVWVVWTTVTPTVTAKPMLITADGGKAIDGTIHPGTFYACSASPTDPTQGNYKFTFSIQPHSIVNTSNDIPKLEGPLDVRYPPPPPGVKELLSGKPLSNGAENKWDASQRIRVELFNPNGIPRPALQAGSGGLYNNQPKEDDVVVDFPADEVVGNDDTLNYEESDVYHIIGRMGRDAPLSHNAGELVWADYPILVVLNYGASEGYTYAHDSRFAAFSRLQINGVWYRTSKFSNWHHTMKVRFKNGSWIDNGSTSGLSPDTN